MMEVKSRRFISKILIKVYVLVFLFGLYLGYSGISAPVPMSILLESTPILLYELSWSLFGMLFGMLWLGVGPIIALYYIGIGNGALLKSYLGGGGALYFKKEYILEGIAAHTLELGAGLMEALAFLYGAVGGMLLAMYYIEVYDSGIAIDETQKINFTRKLAESLLLATAAAGLRMAAL